jgi:hypothetical protein
MCAREAHVRTFECDRRPDSTGIVGFEPSSRSNVRIRACEAHAFGVALAVLLSAAVPARLSAIAVEFRQIAAESHALDAPM